MYSNVRSPEFIENVRLLRERIIGMTGRPVYLRLSRWEVQTAATDCKRSVCLNPRPLDEGRFDIALGICTHEAGHIIYSYHLADVMARAHKEGGEALGTVVNLILDRKDDWLSRQDFPGAKADLDSRASYVMPHVSRYQRMHNLHTDFFYACKAFATPVNPVTKKAMALIKKMIPDFRITTEDQIIETGKAVLKLLGEVPKANEVIRNLILLLVKSAGKESDSENLNQDEIEFIQMILARLEQEEDLDTFLDSDEGTGNSPDNDIEIIESPAVNEIAPDRAHFQSILDGISHLVTPLKSALEVLDENQVIQHRGLEEGEIDSGLLARMIAGDSSVYYQEEIIQIDRTFALCLDISGSMESNMASTGVSKIDYGRRLGVLFNAVLSSLQNTRAHSWMFNHEIFDCGPVSDESGICKALSSGANADCAMVSVVQEYFRKNSADVMIAFFINDGGPDNRVVLKERLKRLRQMGVITVQLFIESEQDREASARSLRHFYDYQFVFGSENIEEMISALAQMLKKSFQRY